MPTILYFKGWRLYFFANELTEPVHIHAIKGEMKCKYWLDPENFEITEAYTNNMNNKDRREIREIIYSNFKLIEEEWIYFQKRKKI
jgi:hypothetical protein